MFSYLHNELRIHFYSQLVLFEGSINSMMGKYWIFQEGPALKKGLIFRKWVPALQRVKNRPEIKKIVIC